MCTPNNLTYLRNGEPRANKVILKCIDSTYMTTHAPRLNLYRGYEKLHDLLVYNS